MSPNDPEQFRRLEAELGLEELLYNEPVILIPVQVPVYSVSNGEHVKGNMISWLPFYYAAVVSYNQQVPLDRYDPRVLHGTTTMNGNPMSTSRIVDTTIVSQSPSPELFQMFPGAHILDLPAIEYDGDGQIREAAQITIPNSQDLPNEGGASTAQGAHADRAGRHTFDELHQERKSDEPVNNRHVSESREEVSNAKQTPVDAQHYEDAKERDKDHADTMACSLLVDIDHDSASSKLNKEFLNVRNERYTDRYIRETAPQSGAQNIKTKETVAGKIPKETQVLSCHFDNDTKESSRDLAKAMSKRRGKEKNQASPGNDIPETIGASKQNTEPRLPAAPRAARARLLICEACDHPYHADERSNHLSSAIHRETCYRRRKGLGVPFQKANVVTSTNHQHGSAALSTGSNKGGAAKKDVKGKKASVPRENTQLIDLSDNEDTVEESTPAGANQIEPEEDLLLDWSDINPFNKGSCHASKKEGPRFSLLDADLPMSEPILLEQINPAGNSDTDEDCISEEGPSSASNSKGMHCHYCKTAYPIKTFGHHVLTGPHIEGWSESLLLDDLIRKKKSFKRRAGNIGNLYLPSFKCSACYTEVFSRHETHLHAVVPCLTGGCRMRFCGVSRVIEHVLGGSCIHPVNVQLTPRQYNRIVALMTKGLLEAGIKAEDLFEKEDLDQEEMADAMTYKGPWYEGQDEEEEEEKKNKNTGATGKRRRTRTKRNKTNPAMEKKKDTVSAPEADLLNEAYLPPPPKPPIPYGPRRTVRVANASRDIKKAPLPLTTERDSTDGKTQWPKVGEAAFQKVAEAQRRIPALEENEWPPLAGSSSAAPAPAATFPLTVKVSKKGRGGKK